MRGLEGTNASPVILKYSSSSSNPRRYVRDSNISKSFPIPESEYRTDPASVLVSANRLRPYYARCRLHNRKNPGRNRKPPDVSNSPYRDSASESDLGFSQHSSHSIPSTVHIASLAGKICQFFEYCYKGTNGTFGIQSTVFPRWVATEFYASDPNYHCEWAWCEEVDNMTAPGSRFDLPVMKFRSLVEYEIWREGYKRKRAAVRGNAVALLGGRQSRHCHATPCVELRYAAHNIKMRPFSELPVCAFDREVDVRWFPGNIGILV